MQQKVSRHLKAEEHILLRPSMYIGSTSLKKVEGYLLPDNTERKIEYQYVPGLLKLVYEILDNSVDIAIKTDFKSGTKISVNIDEKSCTVEDNGSGMPVVMVKDANGKDVWNPVLSWCYTMAGTNFDSDDEGRISMGMNGVGSTVVSIFSKVFTGITCDGSNQLTVVTVDNNILDEVTVKKSKKNGTKVTFEPDFKYFGVSSFTKDHITLVRDRLYKLAACFPEIDFTLNEEKISMKRMQDVVRIINEEHIKEIEDDIVVSAFPNDREEFDFISVVNGLSVVNGGSHIDYVSEKLAGELRPMIEKKYKLNVLPAQIKQHLFISVFMRNFPNMKFDSQTKEFITNSRQEVAEFFQSFNFEKLADNMMKKAEVYIVPIIEHQLLKQEQAEKRKLAAAAKKVLKEKVAKHIAPLSKKPNGNILYIVEGDSAKNNFQPTRDKQRHGMYPLRGKFMNISRKSTLDILENTEVKEIMSILGISIGEEAPRSLRHGYSSIYICADADVDGYCITSQMINFFALWPELFERGIIKIVHTPIMEIRKNNKIQQVFYSLSEYANYTLKTGEEIKYLKGLGSLGEKEYREYIIDNPRIDTVELDDTSDELLEVLFGKNANPRKEWLLVSKFVPQN